MFNTESNAESLVEEFVNIFVNYCNFVNKLNCNQSDVIVLDSSNATKNSYHLIFKTIVFANNLCCKQFIQNVLNSLSPEEIQKISFVDSCGKSKLIVDLSVYKRNQNFRMISSSKFGKNTPLKLVESCINVDSELIFFDSLISDRNLVVNTCSIENEVKCELVQHRGIRVFENENSLKISKFPDIDKVVLKQIGQGTISKIQFYENKGTSKPMIVYKIKDFRYCDNIKRAHKSNSIYFVADVCRSCIYQKCHDCVGYRGKDIFLPLGNN